MKERPSGLTAYFSLFKGEAHTMSEMCPDVKPAIDLLVNEGRAIEQLGLDGDNLIFMPDKKKGFGDPDFTLKRAKNQI